MGGSLAGVLSTGLLGLGALVLVLACVGATLPADTMVRLHYLSLATMAGTPLAMLGLLVRDPGDWFKLVLITLVLITSSPVATAATARAVTRSASAGEGARDGPGDGGVAR
jgi:multisubunit Na+/H+ antiporter MnhG subunit